jgi:hypothetical protein
MSQHILSIITWLPVVGALLIIFLFNRENKQAIRLFANVWAIVSFLPSLYLLTYDRQPYPRLDLRVDVHEEPVGELRRIFNWFRPLIPYYSMRVLDPRVPRYKDWLQQQGNSR